LYPTGLTADSYPAETPISKDSTEPLGRFHCRMVCLMNLGPGRTRRIPFVSPLGGCDRQINNPTSSLLHKKTGLLREQTKL
jgi:hypothetical protein